MRIGPATSADSKRVVGYGKQCENSENMSDDVPKNWRNMEAKNLIEHDFMQRCPFQATFNVSFNFRIQTSDSCQLSTQKKSTKKHSIHTHLVA